MESNQKCALCGDPATEEVVEREAIELNLKEGTKLCQECYDRAWWQE
jgi:hypothetical protein